MFDHGGPAAVEDLRVLAAWLAESPAAVVVTASAALSTGGGVGPLSQDDLAAVVGEDRPEVRGRCGWRRRGCRARPGSWRPSSAI